MKQHIPRELYIYTIAVGNYSNFCLRIKEGNKYKYFKCSFILPIYNRAYEYARTHAVNMQFDDERLLKLFVKINDIDMYSDHYKMPDKKKPIVWHGWQ